MKKSFFAILCMVSMNLNAQTTGNNPVTASTLVPLRSNGYISWPVPSNSTSAYKVNVYREGGSSGARRQLISSTWCEGNYFRFSSEQLLSSDLSYTIAEHDAATGTLVTESTPAAIGDIVPPGIQRCYIDCNGDREAYRLSLWEKANGAMFLSADGAASNITNPVTGTYAPYYQAIDVLVYDQLPAGHPYKRATASLIETIYERDHIRITDSTPGGPFFDAMNNLVTNGWLIEKRMDKYAHFNTSNTGNYGPTTAWCHANIGTATNMFNDYVDLSSVGTITADQYWFLNQTGTNGQGHPIYEDVDELVCTANYGGSGGSGSSSDIEFGQLMDEMIACIDAEDDPLDCIIDSGFGGGFGGTFGGFTVESINNHTRFTASIGNDSGVISVKETTGDFGPGLFRINLFLTDGTIIPGFRAIGVPSVTDSIALTIAPNPIVNSELAFDVVSTTNKTVTLLVQKLDGTTVHAESVALTANTTLSRAIPITGTVPYNQLRVSVISPNGTSVQKTALTQ